MAGPPPMHESDDQPSPANSSRPSPELSKPVIDAQVQRICDSPFFASSESLRRFLRFVVDETLQGKGDRLKEYVVGV